MAYNFNGTNQYLSTGSSPVTNGPLTIACWFNLDTASLSSLISLNDANGQERFSISSNSPVNRSVQMAYVNSSGIVDLLAYSNGTISTGLWYHAAGTISGTGASTTIKVYENGVIGAITQTATLTVANNIDSVIIASRYSTSLGLYADGLIADVGIWNAELSATEIASLSDGMTCEKIRPQNLVFHAPLIRNLQDVKGGMTITNNNTATVATHPRVYA